VEIVREIWGGVRESGTKGNEGRTRKGAEERAAKLVEENTLEKRGDRCRGQQGGKSTLEDVHHKLSTEPGSRETTKSRVRGGIVKGGGGGKEK